MHASGVPSCIGTSGACLTAGNCSRSDVNARSVEMALTQVDACSPRKLPAALAGVSLAPVSDPAYPCRHSDYSNSVCAAPLHERESPRTPDTPVALGSPKPSPMRRKTLHSVGHGHAGVLFGFKGLDKVHGRAVPKILLQPWKVLDQRLIQALLV